MASVFHFLVRDADLVGDTKCSFESISSLGPLIYSQSALLGSMFHRCTRLVPTRLGIA